jgi:hypothetical protein
MSTSKTTFWKTGGAPLAGASRDAAFQIAWIKVEKPAKNIRKSRA